MNQFDSAYLPWKEIPAVTESEIELNWRKNSSEKSDKGFTVLYLCKHGCQAQLKKIFTIEGEIVFHRNEYEHDHENINFSSLSDQGNKPEGNKRPLESQAETVKPNTAVYDDDDDFDHNYDDADNNFDDTDAEQPEVELKPTKAKKSKTKTNDVVSDTARPIPEVVRQPGRQLRQSTTAKKAPGRPRRQLRSRGIAFVQENSAPPVSVPARQCLFCWKPCPDLEQQPNKLFAFGEKEDSIQLERHLQIYFVLRKILDIQASWCEQTLKKEDALSMDSWLKVCDHCMKSVREGWKLHQKITALQEKFKKVKTKLKEEMEKGLRVQKEVMDETGAAERVETEIRKIAFANQGNLASTNKIKVAVIVKKEKDVMDPDSDQDPLAYGYPLSPQTMEDGFDSINDFDEDTFNSASSLLPSPSGSLELNLSDLISHENDETQNSASGVQNDDGDVDCETEEPGPIPKRTLRSRSRSKVSLGPDSTHAPDSDSGGDDDYIAGVDDSDSEDDEFVPPSTLSSKRGRGRPKMKQDQDPLSPSETAVAVFQRRRVQIDSSTHKLKCPRCDHRFMGERHLESHLKLHKEVDKNGDKKYFICTACRFPSNTKIHLWTHFRTWHRNLPPPWRTRTSVSRRGRPRVKPLVFGPKRRKCHPRPDQWKKCPQCTASFLQKSLLPIHIELHEERKRNNETMNPELNCLVCTFPATDSRNLQQHFRKKLHRNPKFEGNKWICYKSKCLEEKATLEEMREHILTKHNQSVPRIEVQKSVPPKKPTPTLFRKQRKHKIIVRKKEGKGKRKLNLDNEESGENAGDAALKSHPKPILWKKCPQCTATFQKRSALEAHIDLHEERKRNNETMNPELNCLVCTFPAPAATPRTLEHHFRKKMHRNPRFEGGQWTCYKCLEVKPTLEEMREHILNEHSGDLPNPEGIMKPPISKKSDESQSLAKEEEEMEAELDVGGEESETEMVVGSGGAEVSNNGEEEFKCPTCNINFNSASALRGHMRLHKIREESDSEFLCKLCPFLAENRSGLSKHYRTKHKIWKRAIQKCPEPNCKFKSFNELFMKAHALTHRSKPENPLTLNPAPAPIPFPPREKCGRRLRKIPPHCRYCPLKFSTYLTLQAHVIQEHPGAPVPESPNPGRYICSEANCGIEFRYRVRLKEHTLSVHQNVRKKHKCDLCEMRFAYKRALNHHKLDVHEGRVPKKKEVFTCNLCDFKDSNAESVRRHKNSVHNTHICEECGAGFLSEDYVIAHRKMRHESEPTPCPYCKKVYPCLDYMKRHLQKGRCKVYHGSMTSSSSSVNDNEQQQGQQNIEDDVPQNPGECGDAAVEEMKSESSSFATDGIFEEGSLGFGYKLE